MPPKKAQKMSLNEFLGDNTLGSWADEMDSLPTAPSGIVEEQRSRLSDAPDRGARDNFRSDRPQREDLPLPTAPPYTAFVGNLSFDVTETEMGDFFAPHLTKSVKVIRDRDDKPKGFGYIEFEELDGLKDAISKSGTQFGGRTVRISVAEPPKERSGPGGGGFDDEKFASNWRRDGPLPDSRDSRDTSRRRYDNERAPAPPSVSDNASDWRSSRTSRPPPEEAAAPRQKRMGFGESATGAADSEETWSKGSRFKPSAPEDTGSGNRFGGGFKKNEPPTDEGGWRRPISRNSQGESAPSTPVRRKLELLPKSAGTSTVPSPLSSPNPANTVRANPFGAARPVDVSAKEAAIAEKLEKDKDRLAMSRTSSKTGTERTITRGTMGPPADPPASSPTNATPGATSSSRASAAANVRPAVSFAAAAGKKDANPAGDGVEQVTKGMAQTQV